MRGDRFKKRLPRFIGNISDIDDTFYAEDKEFELIDRLIDDFDNSQSVSGIAKTSDPDYFLRKLEIDYGLDHKGTTKERIARILLKMRAKRTTTEEVILEICESFGTPGVYTEKYKEYAFLLNLFVNGDIDLGELQKALHEVIPAHLEDRVNLTFGRLLKAETQAGTANVKVWLCGEHSCGEIPYNYTVGQAELIAVKARTSRFDSENDYGLAGEGYRAGELRNDYDDRVYLVQDMSSDVNIDFGGDI